MNSEPHQIEPSPKPKRGILKTLTELGLTQATKKGLGWLAKKLGLKGLIAALAIAGNLPGWVVAAILTALKFLANQAKSLLSKLARAIKDPEKALGLMAIGGLALAVLPITPALIVAVPLIGLGGLGLLSWGVASAGAIAGGFAAKTTAFFVALATFPITAPIAFLVTAILGTLATLTFLTVMTTAAAFILPVNPAEIAGRLPGVPGAGPEFALGEHREARDLPRSEYPNDAAHLAEQVINILEECDITHVNESNLVKVERCLLEAEEEGKLAPGQARSIYNEFANSVLGLEGELECVGFVRGIMAALGISLGEARDGASDFLLPPTPDGFYPLNTNMEELQPGDIAIMAGLYYGHIAIFVGYNEEEEPLFAHSLGTENGLTEITTINPAYFAGFLRPK